MNTQTYNLSETLAAMDAIDAARNEEELLNDELNIEERRKMLKEKLRATYAAQNITVSDEILDKGVNQFFDNRFAHKEIPSSVRKACAWTYINRSIIGKWTAILSCSFICGSLIFVGIDSAVKSSRKAHVIALAKQQQDRVEEENNQKQIAIQREKAVAARLTEFPDKINAVLQNILNVAKETDVIAKANLLAKEAITFATAKDLIQANKLYSEMNDIYALVNSEYQMVINQNGKTGFWRSVNNNPSAKRYYVVVNAISGTSFVNLSIRSEEDGSVKNTHQFAEQVSLPEFEAIRQEKQAKGVLANPVFAEKKRGYMRPSYNIGFKAKYSDRDPESLRITSW